MNDFGAAPAAPCARSGRRVGVVDVGSNSVRLVVFEALTRSPAYFFNEKVLCGLGADLQRSGALSPEGRRRALAAIRRFCALARKMEVDALDGVATAAIRDATDGAEFRDLIEAETGLRLRIASGEDEARLAAQGVLLGWPDAEGLVADLGGASLELVRVGGGAVQGVGRSFPLGPLRLARLSREEADAEIDRALDQARDLMGLPGERLFLVGGAWRAFAKIHMARIDYPLQVLHEFSQTGEDMLAVAQAIALCVPDDLAKEVSASSARLAVTPLGAQVLARLIEAARPGQVAISAFGLREGVLYEHLSPEMRAEDPLLSAARAMETALGRFPGFGDELADWVAPLFEDVAPRRRRIIRAACLLSDVSWNAHPDHRDVACLETVHRANLTGISHGERAFMGATLSHRYRSGRKLRARAPALGLLDGEDLTLAKRLGRAIRLGAMLTGSAPGSLPNSRLAPGESALRLTLSPAIASLSGEMVEKRLAALAQTMGLTPDLRIDAGRAPTWANSG
jgi:exopolyphosphatase/guanosine-5'-triphosphate,3'-diphosphate pyrophosphatase